MKVIESQSNRDDYKYTTYTILQYTRIYVQSSLSKCEQNDTYSLSGCHPKNQTQEKQLETKERTNTRDTFCTN